MKSVRRYYCISSFQEVQKSPRRPVCYDIIRDIMPKW